MSFPQRLRSLVVANSIGGVQDEDYLESDDACGLPQFTALPPDVRELGPSYRAANPRRHCALAGHWRKSAARKEHHRRRRRFETG